MFNTLLIALASSSPAAPAQVDAITFEPWAREHGRSLNSIDFGMDYDRIARRDASFVVTGSQDGTAIVWDLGMKKVRHKLVHAQEVTAAKLMVNQVRVSPEGRRVAVVGADGRLTIWDSRTGAKIHDLQQHTGRISDVNWSGDGNKLATCCDNGKVVVWDSHSGAVLKQFAPDEGDIVLSAITISPDGRTVVFSSRGNKAYFFNVDTGARFNVIMDLAEEPMEIEFSPDGSQLAFAEANTLVIRNGLDGKKIRGFGGHAGDIRGLRWTRDGQRMFTAGDGGEVFEWNLRTSTAIAKGKVAQYCNDVAICMVGGLEKVAVAKPAGIFELQK